MTAGFKDPIASDAVQDHADWLELEALRSADGNASFQDFVAAIRRAGTTDAIEDRSTPDRGSELSQQLADAAFSELASRSLHCGPERYPYELSDQVVQVRHGNPESSPYIFMLLLKYFGIGAGPRNIKGASVFEELSALAGKNYLGGAAAGARASHFGFPRRIGPRGFRPALDALCRELKEGGGSKDGPTVRQQKDAKLDLVVWKPFPDERIGRIIAFGQCAAGGNYQDKATELSPRQFYQRWMWAPLRTEPLVFFFVPRCMPEDGADHISALGSTILFDRCRISANVIPGTEAVDESLNRAKWCKYVLARKLRLQ